MNLYRRNVRVASSEHDVHNVRSVSVATSNILVDSYIPSKHIQLC